MTETQASGAEAKSRLDDPFGRILLGWWKVSIADRDAAGARATAARLRRAEGPVEVLSERAVHVLLARLAEDERAAWASARYRKTPHVLASTMQVLAEVREHNRQSLARRLGAGDPPVMSELRFRRLLSAEGDERAAALRRAIAMADRTCDVPALARDLLLWDEPTRVRWCFHYYGSSPPEAAPVLTDPMPAGDDSR